MKGMRSMPSLAYIIPQTPKCPHGTVRDIEIENKGVLRYIYADENAGFFSRLKIKKLLRGYTVFDNGTARRFHAEKLRRDGTALALSHISEIVRFASRRTPVIIFTRNISDLYSLEEAITTLKSFSIFTTPDLWEEFDSFLMNTYGIAGAVCCAAATGGKTAVIMPSGSDFDASGAENVIDLSNSAAICQTLRFGLPPVFKGAEAALKYPDALETALWFFDIDFSESVKLYKYFQ